MTDKELEELEEFFQLDERSEQKLVIDTETFNDRAVRELAKTEARCLCCLQFGRCTKKECKNCVVNTRLSECKSKMSAYNIERLHSYINEFYVQYASKPEAWMSKKRYVHQHVHYFGLSIVLVFGSILFLWLLNLWGDMCL